MGQLIFFINVTLDGCIDHREGVVNEETHAYARQTLQDVGAALFGRVSYELMEDYWPSVARGEVDAPPEMRAWAEELDRKPKYVVSRSRRDFPWANSHLLEGDLRASVQRLKDETPDGVMVGGAGLARQLDDLGLIDEYRFLVMPLIAGRGPRLLDGLQATRGLELVSSEPLSNGVVAARYRPAARDTISS